MRSFQWHAANSLSSTLSTEEVAHSQELFRELVTWLRGRYKEELVFVTASENFQIRLRGWSLEVTP